MRMNCPACQTPVEIGIDGADMLQLDTEMIEEGEMPDAVGYRLHTDGTVTNIRREAQQALAEEKSPPKIGRHRIEHRLLCPAGVSVSQSFMYPDRLREIVEMRGQDQAEMLMEPEPAT